MLGEFVKLTNNTGKKDRSFQATDYGLAFGHFTYLLSGCQEVVVDLQGVSVAKVPPVTRLGAVFSLLLFFRLGDGQRKRTDLLNRSSDSLHQDSQRPLQLCCQRTPVFFGRAAWPRVQQHLPTVKTTPAGQTTTCLTETYLKLKIFSFLFSSLIFSNAWCRMCAKQ